NLLQHLSGPGPQRSCNDLPQSTRVGVLVENALVHDTVLSGNVCEDVATAVVDRGTGTVRDCPSPVTGSCECVQANLAASLSATPASVSVGQSITYTATVTNLDRWPATNVTLRQDLGGASLLSATGSGATCTSASQQVVCSVATLASGAVATFNIV